MEIATRSLSTIVASVLQNGNINSIPVISIFLMGRRNDIDQCLKRRIRKNRFQKYIPLKIPVMTQLAFSKGLFQ